MDGVAEERKEGQKREIAEPDDVADCQDDVKGESTGSVLDLVHLTHLVEDIDQDKEAIGQIKPTSPALVAVVKAERQGKHLLRNLERKM